MSFRVTARVLLQLGAELISSDFIALYELIKNAVDAGSKRVTISVLVRVPFEHWLPLAEELEEAYGVAHKRGHAPDSELVEIRTKMASAIDPEAPDAADFKARITDPKTWATMSKARNADEFESAWARMLRTWDDANSLTVADRGHGMSAAEIDKNYLTIGTPFRLNQRKERLKDPRKAKGASRPLLGEKGLGRLSSMRLGKRLRIETTKAGESHWNVLDIHWLDFERTSGDPDHPLLVENVKFNPTIGTSKEDFAYSGTEIKIAALASNWDLEKLEDIARRDLAKLTDPFSHGVRYPIKLTYNGATVVIPSFSKVLLEYAHAKVEAQLSATGDQNEWPRLVGRISYMNREKTFELSNEHLASVARDLPLDVRPPLGAREPPGLCTLGEFEMCAFWYNRRILQAVEGIGDRKEVLQIMNAWGGGLMLYRDGFRVMPYGQGADDWLDLDRKAFASAGYKVHRAQLIGRAAISSDKNPSLMDQTNREGLRHSPEKDVLVRLLKYVLETELRVFLTQVDADLRAQEPVDTNELEGRMAAEERNIRSNMALLIRRHPEIKSEHEIVDAIRGAADQIQQAMKQINQMVLGYEEGRSQLLHLAGLGLMVEVLAHEIHRAISHTLVTLAERGPEMTPQATESLFKNLQAQLKTLQKRLLVLDPLTNSARQVKEVFDLGEVIADTLNAHQAQFARHGVEVAFGFTPKSGSRGLRVRAVKGMFVQVLENLISNSVYWLKQKRLLDRGFHPTIDVVLDVDARQMMFSDNGPGIDPGRREDVFLAFYTTKPPGQGRGLGLFIAREIAQYHGAQLYLVASPAAGQKTLNMFVLDLATVKS